MRVKMCNALNSEMYIETQFNKNTLTSYTKSDISTQRLVSLLSKRDENYLMFTVGLQMMNTIFGYIHR